MVLICFLGEKWLTLKMHEKIHIKIIDKMKSLLFLYFCVAMAFSAMASSVSDTYVIPNPQQMVCGDGHFVLRTQAFLL